VDRLQRPLDPKRHQICRISGQTVHDLVADLIVGDLGPPADPVDSLSHVIQLRHWTLPETASSAGDYPLQIMPELRNVDVLEEQNNEPIN
jgi:hypothetical protein